MRPVVFALVLVACRPSSPTTDAPAASVSVPSAAPTLAATPPKPLPTWDAAQCTASGDFQLAAMWSKPACEVDGSGHANGFEPDDQLVVAGPSQVRGKSGGDIRADVTFTNPQPTAVDLVAFVSPAQPLQLHARGLVLVPLPAPGFTRSDHPSWFAKVRLAPKARGHLVVAAKLTSTQTEHMEASSGAPAPYRIVEQPLPPGPYDLTFADLITGHALPLAAPSKLVVE